MKRSAHIFKYLILVTLLTLGTVWGGTDTPTDLKVEIQPAENVVLVTKEAVFTVTVSNISDEDAYKAKMQTSFPVGTATVSGTDWSCSSSDDGDTETVTCQYTGDANWLLHGQSRTLTITRQTSDPGDITQSVTVWADNPDSDNSNNDASATVTAAQTNVKIEKKATDTSGNDISEIDGGSTFDYRIVLSNPADGTTLDASDLTVTDTIADGFTIGSLPSGCSQSGQTITCSGIDLAVGETNTLVFPVTAPQTAPDPNPSKNTATVNRDGYASITNESGWPLTSNETSLTVNTADMQITSMNDTPDPVAIGDLETFSIAIENGGTLTAQNVELNITLSDGFDYQSIDETSAWDCSESGTLVACRLQSDSGSLAPGAEKTLTLKAKAVKLGHYDTYAVTGTTTAETTLANNNGSVSTQIKGADLDITKSGPSDAYADSDVTYTISVSNANGTADADDVNVTDTPDTGMTFVSTDCSDFDQSSFTCRLGTVSAGDSTSFKITWHMPNQTGDIDNKADVVTSTPQDNTQNTSSTAVVTLKAPQLTIDKSVDTTTVGLGETFYYTVKVDNPANQTKAYSLKIKDTLPNGLIIDSLTQNDDGWDCGNFPKTSDYECTLGQLDTGKSSTLIFKAHSDTAGEYTNHVQLDHSLTTDDDHDDAPKVTVQGVELDVTKSGDTSVDIGGEIAYDLNVKNSSLSDAGEVKIEDDISSFGAGFVIASISEGDWDCHASTSTKLDCTLSSLASDDEKSLSFRVSVPDNASPDSVTNRATATSDGDSFDSNEVTTTIRKADIEVTVPSDTELNANENVTFEIVVKNNGPATAKDVNATVDLNTNGVADFANVTIDCGGGTLSGNECRFGDMAQNDSYTIRVNADAPNYSSGDTITNRAAAVTTSSQSQTRNDTGDWSVTVKGATLVAHIDRPAYHVSVGETFPFEIYVENTDGAAAENVKITDVVGNNGGFALKLSNLRFENGSDWSCSNSDDSGFVCTYQSTLNTGEATSKIYVDATVPNDTGVIGLSLYDKATLESDTALSSDSVTPVYKYVYVHGPRLTTTKTVDDDRVSLGQRVTFTITVTNSDGYADANDTNVTDTLPEGFTHITTDGCANDVSDTDNRDILCELGTIGANSNKSFTVTANAPTTDGTYTNTATAATSTPEADTTDNSGSVDVTVIGADLDVIKSSPDPVATNSYFNYTIRLRNIGESPAEGAEVNDTLPSQVTFDSILSTGNGWNCSYDSSDHEVRCSTSDTLDPGYDATVAVVRVRAPGSTGNVLNTVVTATQTSESNLDNNRFELDTLVININLQARKLVNGTVSGINIWSDDPTYVGIGGDIVYEIQVRNQAIHNNGGDSANIPIPDINVSDILPDNITDVSYTADSRFDCSLDTPPPLLGSQELTCTMKDGDTNPLTTSEGWIRVATITAKATETYYYTDPHDAIDENHNWITNKYQAVTSLGDQIPEDNAPGGDYLEAHTLIRPANLSTAKNAPAEAGALQTFEYEVAVTNAPRDDDDPYNQASTAAENVEVEENLPDEVTFIGFSGSGWSLEHNDSDTNTFYFKYDQALDPGQNTDTLRITVRAPNETGLTVTNTAKATTTTAERDDLKEDNEQSADTLILGTDLRIRKYGPDIAGMNKEILYTLSVYNDSNVTAQQVKVADTLPAGVTLPADWDQSGTEWNCSAAGTSPEVVECLYGDDIPGGENADVTLKVTTPSAVGTITNEANVSALTVETDYGNNRASFETRIEGAALAIVSVDQSPDNNPGVGAITPVDYNVTVLNTGYSDSDDLNLTLAFERTYSDPYEFNVTATAGDWNCDAYDLNDRTLRCTRPSLEANASTLLTVRAVAPNTNRDVGYRIEVFDLNQTDIKDDYDGVTRVIGADLNITKLVEDPEEPGYHDDNVTVGLNKSVRFKIVVANDGPGLAKNVTMQDIFDDAFSDLNITGVDGWSDCALDTGHLTCTLPELSRDDDPVSVVIEARASATETNTTNRANIDSYTVETDMDNNEDDATVLTVGSRLTMEMNATKTDVAFLEPLDYNLTVTNVGKTSAVDLNVTDTLPEGFVYVGFDSESWSCDSDDNRSILCRLDELAGYGASATAILHVKAAERIGDFVNEANLTSPSVTAPVTAAADAVHVHGADLNVSITPAEQEVLEEHNTSVSFFVENIDLSEAFDVNTTVTFASPHAVTIVDVNDTACDIDTASATLLCRWPRLDAGAKRSVGVTLQLPNVADDENVTISLQSVTATEEPDYDNNDAGASLLIRAVKPIAEWRLDECTWSHTAADVNDSSGHGHNGTAYGDAMTVNKILTKDRNGRTSFYRAGRFDGDEDYIRVPDSDELNKKNQSYRTYTLWFRMDDVSSSSKRGLLRQGNKNVVQMYVKRGKLYYQEWIDGDSRHKAQVKTSVTADEWHFAALVVTKVNDAYQMRAYLDGTLVGTDDAYVVKGDKYFFLGSKKNGSDSLAGDLDEVKVFNIALDDETIQKIYEREKVYVNYDGTAREPEMTCHVDAAIREFYASPSSVAVETGYGYKIVTANDSLEPIEEMNLTVTLPESTQIDPDDPDTLLTSGQWDLCTLADHTVTCTFSDEGNLSNAWFKNETGTVEIRLTAPNLVGTLTASAEAVTAATDENPDNNRKDANVTIYGTNLRVVKTTSVENPSINQPFVYTISVTNDSTVPAKAVKLVDFVPDGIDVTDNNHSEWDYYAENADSSIIEANISQIDPGETKRLILSVTAPRSGTFVNLASASAYTAEADLLDNNGTVSVTVGTTESNTTVILKDGFSKRETQTRYGDMVVIGNTALTGDSDPDTILADINATMAATSNAKLILPYEDANITVTYARLYWTGHLHGEPRDYNDNGLDDTSYKEITFITPKNTYRLTADDNDTFYYYNKSRDDTYRRIYACSYDVTALINQDRDDNGSYNGYYGVRDLKANEGEDPAILMAVTEGNTTTTDFVKIGHFGGWSLVVFYQVDHRGHRSQVYKNINLFDGFKRLIPTSVGFDRLVIGIDGFLTPYAGDKIDSRLMLFNGGGERARPVDRLSLVRIDNGVAADVNVSDDLNPADNVLNGTIDQLGQWLEPRNPNLEYSVGIDMDQFDISSRFDTGPVFLGHLQSETNITLSVGRTVEGDRQVFDQAFPSAIGLSTEIYNPDFIDSFKDCYVPDPLTGAYTPCSETNITRGGYIVYRVAIVNTGNTYATNLVFQDPLPAEVTWVDDQADVKVVSRTEPLCNGFNGSPNLDGNTSYAAIQACRQWLIDEGYFNPETGLTPTGRNYIDSLDLNVSNNHLRFWDTGFPSDLISTESMTNQEMLDADPPLTTIQYPDNDVNRTLLTIQMHERLNYDRDDINGTFPALHVSWVEFKVKVNNRAILNKRFVNQAVINFTNPTLAYFGYPDADQRQESASNESPPVVFEWTAIATDIRDPGRTTVGTKIVNHPFDLNISIDDSNSTFASFAANYPDVNLTVWDIRLVDRNLIPPGGSCDSYMPIAQVGDFDRNAFSLIGEEYLPIGSGMYWLTDKNITLPTAWRDLAFCLQFKIRYRADDGMHEQVSPAFYGPFGDDFAMRPRDIQIFTSVSPVASGIVAIKAAQPFDLEMNATDGFSTMGVIGYNVSLDAGDITDSNISLATISIFDDKNCTPDITNVVHLRDINFTNGVSQAINDAKFDDVGFITIKVRDTNWTYVDRVVGDCNTTADNNEQNSSLGLVSCFIKGERRFLFVPADINVTTETINAGHNVFTYMAHDLDDMHAVVKTTVQVLNAEGNITHGFYNGCYADDVNMSIDINVSSYEPGNITLLWKESNETTINTVANLGTGLKSYQYTISEGNFSDGKATLDFWIGIDRNSTAEHYPVSIDTRTGRAQIDDYLGVVPVPETNPTALVMDLTAHFWYGRIHAPDYRSATASIATPIYVEVFCDNDRAACSDYALSGLPESSDDVNWWVNRHDNYIVTVDLNATQKGVTSDPFITIDGGANAVADLNLTMSGGVSGNGTPTITYTGNSKLYRTRILMRVHEPWLRFNRFFADGRTDYNVEFNLPTDEWSGIGQLGQTVETNGSTKSNRRLEW